MEVIVVVLLVSILASVMVAVVAVILRNAPATEARVGNSHSYQGLATWLPRDAASTPPTEFILGSAAPICDGATAGLSLVQMAWTPNDGENTTYAADYRLDGTTKRIERHTCWETGGALPYANTESRAVTDGIFDATATTLPGGVAVSVTLTTCGPDCSSGGPTITFEASSRNPGPANTLPPP